MRIFLIFWLTISDIFYSIGCAMAEDNVKRGFSFMSIGFGVLCSLVFFIILSYINIV